MIRIINLPAELKDNVRSVYSLECDVIAMVSDVIELPIAVTTSDKYEFVTFNVVVVRCVHHFEGTPLIQCTNYDVELTSDSIAGLTEEVERFIKDNSAKKEQTM